MDIGGNIPPQYANDSFPLRILRWAFSSVGEQPACWHEDLEFKLIASGTTIAVIDSENIVAVQDEILFVNPYQIHSLPIVEYSDRQYYLFMLSLDFFQKLGIPSFDLRKIFMEDKIRIRNHIRNPKLTEILKRLLDADASVSSYKQQHILGLFMEFFAILLEEEKMDSNDTEMHPDRKRYYMIEPALKVIHSQYNQKIESESLAKLCQMSLCYFCRIFRQVLGMTPTQYQTEYRIRIAEILLKNSQHSISDIAHMVGYDDEAYFSRCYKKCKGISPRQVKNKKLPQEIYYENC